MRRVILFAGLLFVLQHAISAKIIIFTDLEPDDRHALHLVAAAFKPDDIAFVGTTVMHAGRKQVLVRRLLDQLGMKSVPVYQGTGGSSATYPDIHPLTPARAYTAEGSYIFDRQELAAINALPISSDDVQKHLQKYLETENDVEILLLAPPTDLVAVLKQNPELKKSIKQIHVMGGWARKEGRLYTSYNWNMDPVASSELISWNDIPMTLYSTDVIREAFAYKTVNESNFPEIFKTIDTLKGRMLSLAEGEAASLSWDMHVIEKMPNLKTLIEKHVGRQYTPADPLVVVGMVNNRLITATRQVTVQVSLDQLDPLKGYLVTVETSPASKITLVEGLDTKVFETETIRLLQLLSVN